MRQLLDGDLDIVVLKALEKDRDRRYGTPQDFAADVDRFLLDQPVLAVPPSFLYLLRKYARRHKAAIMTAAALLTMLILATGTSTWQAIRASRYAKEANVERRAAVAAKDASGISERAARAAEQAVEQTAEERRRLLYAADMALASQLWHGPNGDLKRINELLTKWLPDDAEEDWRDFSWRYLWTQLRRGAAVTISETSGATVSSDGNLITADKSGIHEWDERGKTFKTRWTGDATDVVFSPNRRWMVLKIGDTTRIIEIESGRMVLHIPYQLCSFSTGGEFVNAWEAGTSTLRVWELSDGEPEARDPLVVADILYTDLAVGVRS